MKKLLICLVVVFIPGLSHAHPGGTDQWGCHMDHKTGLRHCH